MAEAVRKLKSKTMTPRELNELSAYFFPLATNIARKLARKGKEEDAINAGYFGIAHALLKAGDKMYDDDLESWVKSCIYRFVRRQMVTDHMVCIPNTTLREARARGESIEMMRSHPLERQTYVTQKTNRYEELLEKLDTAATEPLDSEIIRLRLEGFTDQEVGEILGKSNSDIQRRRKRLEGRFKILMEEQ